MGLSVDRQFKQCGACGGKIQIDTMEYPGEGDGPPVHEDVEMHIGSCTPRPSEEVVAEEPHPGYGAPAESKAEAKPVEQHADSAQEHGRHARGHRG